MFIFYESLACFGMFDARWNSKSTSWTQPAAEAANYCQCFRTHSLQKSDPAFFLTMPHRSSVSPRVVSRRNMHTKKHLSTNRVHLKVSFPRGKKMSTFRCQATIGSVQTCYFGFPYWHSMPKSFKSSEPSLLYISYLFMDWPMWFLIVLMVSPLVFRQEAGKNLITQ